MENDKLLEKCFEQVPRKKNLRIKDLLNISAGKILNMESPKYQKNEKSIMNSLSHQTEASLRKQ